MGFKGSLFGAGNNFYNVFAGYYSVIWELFLWNFRVILFRNVGILFYGVSRDVVTKSRSFFQ